MLRLAAFVLVFLGSVLPLGAEPPSAPGVTVLNYHDVKTTASDRRTDDPYTMTLALLRAHFDYLKDNGFTVVSLDDYLLFARGKKALPAKSVLLTFDDGYRSFYDKVFPLLQEYRFPAVLAMIGVWQEAPPPDQEVVTWAQAREMVRSGLVEVACHSYNLHHQVRMNRYGDLGYAVTTRIFADGVYETEEAYRKRIGDDLAAGRQQFERELGRKVRALVWPYGETNEVATDLALKQGYEVLFGLEGGFNRPGPQALREARRAILVGRPPVADLAHLLRYGGVEPRDLRVLQLDLDALWDPSPSQFETNLRIAVARIHKTNANTVFLQAFADDKGDGDIRQVYFYNTLVPVKADVFSHVAQRLDDAGVRVFAWIPTLATQWLTETHPEDLIQASSAQGRGWYHRATPFSLRVRDNLRRLLGEMALYSPVTGLMFQDDLYMTDYEDFSPAARAAFQSRFGKALTPEAVRDPETRTAWTRFKATALTDLTRDITAEVRRYRTSCPTARNIYAEAVSLPEALDWYAQDYRDYLATYDYTVVMAYPYMEKKGDRALSWLRDLAGATLAGGTDPQKVVFKLQNYDWTKKRWIPLADLVQQVRTLREAGIVHLGYYPENLYGDPGAGSPFPPP